MSFNYQAAVSINAEFKGQAAVENARKSIKSLEGDVKGIAGTLGKAGEAFKLLAEAFLAKEAIKFGFEFAKGIIEMGKQLDEMSQKTGIGVKSLSALTQAAGDTSVDVGALSGALKKFNVNTVEAAAGNKTLVSAFDSIGISVGDLKTLKPDELIFKVADQFAKFADGPSKAAVAVALFGKQGADLIPMLDMGSQAIRKLGLDMSDDFAHHARELEDTLNQIQRNFKQTGVNILEGTLPAIQQVAAAFQNLTAPTKAAKGDLDLLNNVIKYGSAGMVAFSEAVIEGADLIVHSFRVVFAEVKPIFANLIDYLQTRWGQLLGFFKHQDIAKLGADMDARFTARFAERDKTVADLRSGLMDRTGQRVKNITDFWNNATGVDYGQAFGPPSPGANQKKPTIKYAGKQGEVNDKKFETEAQALSKYALAEQESIDAEKERVMSLGIVTPATLKHKIAQEEMTKALKATVGFEPGIRDAYLSVTKEVIAQKQALIDLAEAQKDSIGVGAKQAFAEYVQTARDTAAQFKQAFGSALKGLEDAMVKFVMTGKLSFKDLVNTIEEELVRIAVKKAIAFGITAVAGGAAFASGGIMTGSGPMPLKKYAMGGIANSPQMALFGEGRMPEAYVPLPDGRSIPVSMKGGGGGGNTSVVVNVTLQDGGGQNQDTKANDDRGQQLGGMIKQQVLQTLVEQKRPGGLLA